MAGLQKPMVIYDGDCQFCRRIAKRWEDRSHGRIDYVPYQEASARFPKMTLEQFEESIQWVVPPAEIHEGAEAVCRIVEAMTGRSLWLDCYRTLPGFAPLAEGLYRLVSRNRRKVSWLAEKLNLL